MILLVEDNESIAKALSFSLLENGYNIEVADSFRKLKEYLDKDIELIILDVTLPDGDGFEIYENYIKGKNIKTIFLTARDSEEDIVKGLELGADDYLTKPFSTRELLVRIKKIILRNRKQNIIKVRDITFDIDKMEVYKNNSKILLSSMELNILNILFLNLNKVVTRESLLEKIWEWTGNDVDDHTLTVYVKRIKDKIGEDIITTIKKVGYRIDEK
ncbi:MAG: response regulator transcription factor [Bacilli bacterium]|nr:response regulator transcription factor [Bacilli bacterium]